MSAIDQRMMEAAVSETGVDVLDTDGQVVRLRRCRIEDTDQIRALLTGLSPRSRYLRFFSAGTSVVERELARLTRAPGPDHAAGSQSHRTLVPEPCPRPCGIAWHGAASGGI